MTILSNFSLSFNYFMSTYSWELSNFVRYLSFMNLHLALSFSTFSAGSLMIELISTSFSVSPKIISLNSYIWSDVLGDFLSILILGLKEGSLEVRGANLSFFLSSTNKFRNLWVVDLIWGSYWRIFSFYFGVEKSYSKVEICKFGLMSLAELSTWGVK